MLLHWTFPVEVVGKQNEQVWQTSGRLPYLLTSITRIDRPESGL